MCGIAGYSLAPRSSLERTLGAQALLAAIAERGADAVGYAYRSPGDAYPTVVKQRTPASQLLERVSVPAEATQLLVHVRDYTKGHPSIAANNHPVRHGPVVGIHNGIIVNDDELLAHHSCARAEPRMTVDSEAIFALAAHSRNDARALEQLRGAMATAWLDEREPELLFVARGDRPAALGRRGPRRRLLRLDGARARDRRALLRHHACASARCARARARPRGRPDRAAASASGPTSSSSRTTRSRPCAPRRSASSASARSRRSPPRRSTQPRGCRCVRAARAAISDAATPQAAATANAPRALASVTSTPPLKPRR